jgi:hypothetical protein
MDLITTSSVIVCDHQAKVIAQASRTWVKVGGPPVLVDNDPEGRVVSHCPNIGPTMKPCTTTLRVAAGYSGWIKVDGKAVVLSNLDGLTDGTVPGTVHYRVRDSRQHFVRADS